MSTENKDGSWDIFEGQANGFLDLFFYLLHSRGNGFSVSI